jgi:hypothetical protein
MIRTEIDLQIAKTSEKHTKQRYPLIKRDEGPGNVTGF